MPTLWWRSVGHTHTGYAVECFIDELLQAAGQDPVEGRLALMGRAPRAAGVLRAVAELADWSGPGPINGRARGVAVVEELRHLRGADRGGVGRRWRRAAGAQGVVRGRLRRCGQSRRDPRADGGRHRLWPRPRAVCRGDARPGPAGAGNFDTYRSLRIHEMPEVEVTIVRSTEKPTGVGEPGVPPIGPAVANAMARLGLGRPRRLPMRGGTV